MCVHYSRINIHGNYAYFLNSGPQLANGKSSRIHDILGSYFDGE